MRCFATTNPGNPKAQSTTGQDGRVPADPRSTLRMFFPDANMAPSGTSAPSGRPANPHDKLHARTSAVDFSIISHCFGIFYLFPRRKPKEKENGIQFFVAEIRIFSSPVQSNFGSEGLGVLANGQNTLPLSQEPSRFLFLAASERRTGGERKNANFSVRTLPDNPGNAPVLCIPVSAPRPPPAHDLGGKWAARRTVNACSPVRKCHPPSPATTHAVPH